MSQLKRLRDWILKPPYSGVPWLVLCYVAFCYACYPHGGVFAGLLSGYDDHVRMTQVLNWVNGAGWYDRLIARVDPPDGFQSIWTRIVDIPIAAIIVIAQQFTDQQTAALVAAVVIPFIELAILFLVARYFARPIIGKKSARLIVLFLMFTSVLNFQVFSIAGFHNGEASHHSWYVILVLLLFGSAGRLAIGVAGLLAAQMMSFAIALLLAVGIEGFPIIAGTCAVLAFIAWLYNRPLLASKTAQAMLYGGMLSLLMLPLHQPPDHLFDVSFAEPSILGPILMGIAAVFFAVEAMLLDKYGGHKFIIFLGLCVAAAVFACGIVTAFPQILDGPAAALTPAERAMAFRSHAEAWPLYKAANSKLNFLNLAMPTVIALIAGIVAIRINKNPRRRATAIAYFGFTAITGGAAEFIARFYHHAMTSACVWLLWAWQKIKLHLPKNRFYVMISLLAFVALGPLWMLILPDVERHAPFVSQFLLYPAKLQTISDPCDVIGFGHYLDQHFDKNTLVMAPGADSSRLLYYSNLRIDFLNNYPSHDKFIDNEVFFGTQDMSVAKDIALRHGIDLVAVCHVLNTAPPLKPGEEPMMFERLEANETPSWLIPVDTGLHSMYKLYRVDKTALHQAQ